MDMRTFDDETLMAFADGELDDATTRIVEAAVGTDESVAQRVALFLQTRSIAAGNLKPLIDAPVPPTLTQAVERMIAAHHSRHVPAEARQPAPVVVPFARPDAARRRATAPRWLPAMAASIAIVAAGGGYLTGRTFTVPVADAGMPLSASPAIAAALSSAASGDSVALDAAGRNLRLVATFEDGAQALCREFELFGGASDPVMSVACHGRNGWRIVFAAATSSDASGFQPASSAEAVDAYLSTIGAGPAIVDDEERRVLSALPQSTDR